MQMSVWVCVHVHIHVCVGNDVDLMQTYLQSNGSGQTRESSGSFVSFLAKHTLLTSGPRLAIAALWEVNEHENSGTLNLIPPSQQLSDC